MHFDRGIQVDLQAAGTAAVEAEKAGFEGVWTSETTHDPFLISAFAAAATKNIAIGTSVVIAFARTPMTTAYSSWDIQSYSKGRFILGLGTQIKPHIERRYAMAWSRPAARMREFIAALHAIWDSWQEGTKLDFRGDFYSHTLMTPVFSPPPNVYGAPPIFMAGVGETMLGVAGQVADGFLVHPLGSQRYLEAVAIPAVMKGLSRADRQRSEIQIVALPIVVTGDSEAEMNSSANRVRNRLAFYASTPAYRPVLEVHGWGDLQTALRELSLKGAWEEMGNLIDDEILNTFAIVAEPDKVQSAIVERFGNIVDRAVIDDELVQDNG